MSPSTRSTRKYSATDAGGFTALELLIGVMLMGLAVAATSGMFVASKRQMQAQQRQLETTTAARATVDMIVRDLRLGGACMPVTGDFISLDGTNNGQTDEIITRSGLTRPDLTCVSTVVPNVVEPAVPANATTFPVQSSDGFTAGMHVYIRHPDGEGEYFDITSVPSATQLGKTQALSRNYPSTSGIYAVDERRFYLDTFTDSHGVQPELMLQVGSKPPQQFAVGIEKLDVKYQLQRNCPPCDVIDLPGSNAEWSIVDALVLNVTARSEEPDQSGNYYRRTVTVNVKPRNLLPQVTAPGEVDMGRIRNSRGMALIGIVILSALLVSLAVGLAVQLTSDTQLRGAYGNGVTGFYAAESGLNTGMGEYRNIFLNYDIPHGTDFDPRTMLVGERTVTYKMTERPGNPLNIVIPSGELFAGLNALQYRYIVNSEALNVRNDVEAGVGAEFLVGYIPLFQFVAFYKNDLEIAPGPPMHLQGRVHTNGDLYLNGNSGPLYIEDNPPVGIFTVQVSSGKKIYRGRKRQDVCEGNVWVDKLEDQSPLDGSLDAKELLCNGGTTREVPASELALWKGSMISELGNIAIPEPDIIKPPAGVSAGGSADPGAYWEKADLRIVLHLNRPGSLGPGPTLPHSIDVVDATGAQDVARTTALRTFMRDAAWNVANGTYPGTMPIFYTDVPFSPLSTCAQGQPACSNADPNSYTPPIPAPMPGGAPPPNARNTAGGAGTPRAYTEVMGVVLGAFDLDYRRGGYYNWREKKWMVLLNINASDLILWNQQNGEPFFATTDSSEGGLVIFATVDGPDSGIRNNYGVRVFGSADIPLPGGIGVSADPTGLTVATDQAIYVLGNFNRGTAGGGLPRQPASLIGDSVNVLSQNYWKSSIPAVCGGNCCTNEFCRDGQSGLSLGNAARNAATTWINAAFLGGVDTTPLNGGVAAYNGGLENYPRFHENWSGLDLNYQGSFVSLGEPEHVNGAWCGTGGAPCDIYNPPNRNWNFDPAFNNAANLPPLTPRFVYVQQVLFTEDFK